MCCGRVGLSSCSLRHDGSNAIVAMPNRRGGHHDGRRLWIVEEGSTCGATSIRHALWRERSLHSVEQSAVANSKKIGLFPRSTVQ
jgi:hypothetical protein